MAGTVRREIHGEHRPVLDSEFRGPARAAAAAGPAGPVVPDQDLVKQLLDQMELKYVVDDEGDLAAPWEEFRTYFMFRGEDDQQVFSVRTFYDRPHEHRGEAAAAGVDRRLEPPHPVAQGLQPHPRRRHRPADR